MENKIKENFPYLKNNPDVVYFDSAATSLKPQPVIDAVNYFYTHLSSNVNRGEYHSSQTTSELFEGVREKVANFFNIPKETVIFTKNASESLNLAATGFFQEYLKEGDVILLNEAEHASNILPWFKVADKTGAEIEFIRLDQGKMDLNVLESRLKKGNVKVLSIAHVSNVLGVIQDIQGMADLVHRYDAYLCVDGAQAVGHFEIDLLDLDCDFYSFSAHKMFGPSGVGVLIGKKDLLEKMIPLHYGGGSNARFNRDRNLALKAIPYKFESGTPNIEGVLGFGAAIDFIESVGLEYISKHEKKLKNYLLEKLRTLEQIEVYNPYTDVGLVSFNVKGIFAQDVAHYLNHYGISVRSGNHCSKLIDGVFSEEMSVRLSMSVYNTKDDIDRFIEVISSITLEKTIDLYL